MLTIIQTPLHEWILVYMQVIAIASGKGGVGKTTTTHTLGWILSEKLKVLMLDLDPQCSLTACCNLSEAEGTISDVLATPSKLTLAQAIRPLSKKLSMLPSSPELASIELSLSAKIARETIIKRMLATATGYDVCLIDCSPSTGLLVLNALTAANGVILPVVPEAMNLYALRSFLDVLDEIRATVNPELQTIGTLVNFYNARSNHHQQALDEITRADIPVLGTVGRTIRIAEAVVAHEPITAYEAANERSTEYRAVAKKVKQWLEKRN